MFMTQAVGCKGQQLKPAQPFESSPAVWSKRCVKHHACLQTHRAAPEINRPAVNQSQFVLGIQQTNWECQLVLLMRL